MTPFYLPAITRVCRLLRLDSMKKFYANNTFVTRSLDTEARIARLWQQCLIKTSSAIPFVLHLIGNQLNGSSTTKATLALTPWPRRGLIIYFDTNYPYRALLRRTTLPFLCEPKKDWSCFVRLGTSNAVAWHLETSILRDG